MRWVWCASLGLPGLPLRVCACLWLLALPLRVCAWLGLLVLSPCGGAAVVLLRTKDGTMVVLRLLVMPPCWCAAAALLRGAPPVRWCAAAVELWSCCAKAMGLCAGVLLRWGARGLRCALLMHTCWLLRALRALLLCVGVVAVGVVVSV